MLYQKGEKLYLEGQDAEIAVAEQADALETDEREGKNNFICNEGPYPLNLSRARQHHPIGFIHTF